MKVLKFQLNDVTTLELPAGAQVLSARYQESMFGTGVQLWVLCPKHAPKQKVARTFVTTVTGSRVKLPIVGFVGTIETPLGEIGHVFEVTTPSEYYATGADAKEETFGDTDLSDTAFVFIDDEDTDDAAFR